MDNIRPFPAYPTLPSPASATPHNPPDLPLSTPTNRKASFTSSPSPLSPTTITTTPPTTNLTILPCTLSSLPHLLPLLTTTIPLNPFTALMFKPPHNTQPTAHQNLATWLYTVAFQDPRAKIIALVAVETEDKLTRHDSAVQPSTPEAETGMGMGMGSREGRKKPQARVLGVAWLQHFFPGEQWETRYPIHIDKREREIPHVINTKGYTRAMNLLYTHREDCVGAEGGWYIRNIAANPGQGSEDVICYLLEYASSMFAGAAVYWQAPPFRSAGMLYERIGWRWGMAGGRVVEGGDGMGEGLDWVGWVCRGEGDEWVDGHGMEESGWGMRAGATRV